MKKHFLICISAVCALGSFQIKAEDVSYKDGPYTADWNSLSEWECPEWFKDAKFGIWAHWGPQCEAEAGDWYARFMYYPGSGQNQFHVSHYGDPAKFGLKDLCNEWKAENWNPKELVDLYKSVGARYFMTLANHHDNMDLWDSPYQEWNTVNIGPKRDLVGEWAKACKEADLPLGVSVHASHAWTWLEPSQAYDGNLTKEDGYKPDADGSEKWWKGLDPQELYAQNHPHSSGWENSGTIHSQWEWGNGASLPSEEYKKKLMNRTLQLVYDYSPDIVYFDDTVLPFYGCDEQWGKDFLSSYYNDRAEKNGGIADVVVTGKQLRPEHKEAMLWDVERGIPDKMQDKYWQTCTCIGDWHYNQGTYNNNGYKSAATVVRMLTEVISKNGNLLLSVPVKGDGTIDDKERKILSEIKDWMDINSEAIYGTRVWKIFGEGPLAEVDNPLSGPGFNEGQNYTASDIRFVQKNGTVYATPMGWPGEGDFTIKSFSPASLTYSGNVTSVKLLGYGDLPFTLDAKGLTVKFPAKELNSIAPVLAITTDNATVSDEERLDNLILFVKEFITDVKDRSSFYNTGLYDKASFVSLENALQTAENSEKDIRTYNNLKDAYDRFIKSGRNKGAVLTSLKDCEADVTIDVFGESSNFARAAGNTRFGRPSNWTVENFKIPQKNNDGTKEGLDKYSGREALMLGVWNDKESNKEGDLENARIYKKVKLPGGLYFFGGAYNTTYNITHNAYMFVAQETVPTSEIPDKALAYYPIKSCSDNLNEYNGLYFYLPEEQDVIIGWQADLKNGSDTQEFRVEKVALLKLKEVDTASLADLCDEVEKYLNNVEERGRLSDNTGFHSQDSFLRITAALEKAKDNLNDPDINSIYFPLKYEWDLFIKSKNSLGEPAETFINDLTEEYFIESESFSTVEGGGGKRFAKPKYWTVENFSIPNGNDGVKEGHDSYTNTYALMLGIWEDRSRNKEGDLENARIYRKIHLEPGKYYFGARYNALHYPHEAYAFVSEELTKTSEIPDKAISFGNLNEVRLNNKLFGMTFTIEQPGDYYIGWQADLKHGPTCQEFRAEKISFLAENNSGTDEITIESTPQISIYNKTLFLTSQSNVSIYDVTGRLVKSTYGMSVDCRDLHGLYIVRAGNKSIKTVF